MRYVNCAEDIEKSIYIYGAGMVAKLLCEYADKNNIRIVAFVVTDNGKEENFIHGIPVCSIRDIINDYPVIIATLSNAHKSIEKELISHGFSNYGAVSETLFETMRTETVARESDIASAKLRMSEMKKLYDGTRQSHRIVSDSPLWERKELIVSSRDFLKSCDKTETVYILLIKWQEEWRAVIDKAFCTAEHMVLSFRYKFLDTEDYSLIREAKKHGYQLSGEKRFLREEREYFTEDVLLWFEKRKPQTLQRDKLCEGCGLCERNCPTRAIALLSDEHGYNKPWVDKKQCVNCGKCIQECPAYLGRKEVWTAVPKTYAYMGNDEIRQHSSSGGVFGTIAEFILDNQGYVCGASWVENFRVEHIVIADKSELHKLQMSKYIRSDIRAVMPQIRNLLLENRTVLFVGCPCQVAAVKAFIGEKSHLFTMDLICAEAPSHKIFMEYIKDNYDVSDIKELAFREKDDGWRPDSFTITDKKGRRIIKHMEDSLQKAFHSRILMDIACEHCNFLAFPRVGDLTIGDGWGISEHTRELDDGKGTSSVIINSKKGKKLYGIASKYAKREAEIPFEWTKGNRTINSVFPHAGRDRFYREIWEFNFNKAFEDADKDQYDIGVVGLWSYPNYGSELTYFALYHTLKDMGYSVLMIEWPEDSYWKPYGCTQLFETEPYANNEIAPLSRNHYEMRRYNDKCRMFLVGSDQLLNPNLYHGLGEVMVLDWVEPEKKKIGYALSIGREDVKYTLRDRKEIAYCLDKFHAVSVREKFSVEQMRDFFGITATWTLDPVFLCDRSWYESISSKGINRGGKGVFAYILDFEKEFLPTLMDMAYKMGRKLIVSSDAAKKGMEEDEDGCAILYDLSVEEWIANIKNSDLVVTDSFHGVCFAVIFQKDFIALRNYMRGGARLDSILGLLGLKNRLFDNIKIACESVSMDKKIDFQKVEKILEVEKSNSILWLRNALNQEHQMKYSDEELLLEERFRRMEAKFFKQHGR